MYPMYKYIYTPKIRTVNTRVLTHLTSILQWSMYEVYFSKIQSTSKCLKQWFIAFTYDSLFGYAFSSSLLPSIVLQPMSIHSPKEDSLILYKKSKASCKCLYPRSGCLYLPHYTWCFQLSWAHWPILFFWYILRLEEFSRVIKEAEWY